MKVNKFQVLFDCLHGVMICRVSYVVIALTLLSACASLPTQVNTEANQESSATEESLVNEEPAEEVKDPPNMALTAELLEQLMISNFASYAGDWDSAISSALSAAQISQDFRLARLASVLALRDRSYQDVAVASELWYELDDQSEDAYNTLMIGLLGDGQVDAALEKFDDRLAEIEANPPEDINETPVSGEYQPNSPLDVHIRQVTGLLVRQQNSEAAMQIVEKYVNRSPNSAQVLLSSSYVAEYFEQDEIAEQWLNQTLQLKPDWDAAAQMYSNMLARQERDSERLAYIRLYIDDNPKSVPMRIQYAAELARIEDYQGSLDIMRQVVDDDPENIEAVIYAAALARQLEQIDVSEDLYQRALEIESDNDRVLWALAGIAIEQEEYREAERYYARIGRGESYFRAQLQIANMRYESRGIDSAVNYLRLIEPRTEGEYVEIALARHYLLLQENEYEDAFGYINDSLVYLPDNVDMLYARALVAAELRDVVVAENDLRSIIDRHPDHSSALNALGYTLADQTQRYEEAKELIAKALEIEPDEGHILDSMGWVLYRQGDYDGAIEFLERAFEVMREAEIASHLGEVYWESGQQQAARDTWRIAYELDATNAVLIETLERYGLQELYANQQVVGE